MVLRVVLGGIGVLGFGSVRVGALWCAYNYCLLCCVGVFRCRLVLCCVVLCCSAVCCSYGYRMLYMCWCVLCCELIYVMQ